MILPDPSQAYDPFQASYFPDLIKIIGYWNYFISRVDAACLPPVVPFFEVGSYKFFIHMQI